MEILYDRVLQLEQEVSALKRNFADRLCRPRVNRLGPAITAAARRDGLRIGVFIVHRLIGILGHRFDFAYTPP